MAFMRFLFRPVAVLVLLTAALFTYSCSDDEGTNPPPATADYFPYGYNYRWTYTSNILAEQGLPVIEFEMKIDTATSWNDTINQGIFDYLMIRPADASQDWGGFVGLKDSGNVVYALGDHPPQGHYPLFQHSYAANEGVRETITVQGVTYNAIRVDVQAEQGVTISMWFAPNVGLIKEYSEKGGSIFTDDQFGEDVIMNTELVKFEKLP